MKKATLFLTFLFLLGFTAKAQQHSTTPFVIGVIDSFRSNLLNETRTINVYLPQRYAIDTALTYPVIYVLDGAADEDFIHIAGLVQYFNFPWINQFPESIVIGIVNTNRRRDFTFPVSNLDFLAPMGFSADNFPAYGGSAAYISFIEKELQPYVAQHYRTTNGKTLIGQSLGGLLASEVLLRHTQLFDTYILISPSLWWGKEALLKEAGAFNKLKNKPKVYLSVGNEGNTMVGDAKKLDALLRLGGNNKVHFDYLSKEDHATIGHQAVYNAFKLLYPDIKK